MTATATDKATRCVCSTCGVRFRSPQARMFHEGDMHSPRGKSRRANAAAKAKAAAEREPSMGELVAQASLDKACGLPVDPDIEAMFGDYL